jgi:hypothetical protein
MMGLEGRIPVEEATRIGLEVLHTVLRHTPNENFKSPHDGIQIFQSVASNCLNTKTKEYRAELIIRNKHIARFSHFARLVF